VVVRSPTAAAVRADSRKGAGPFADLRVGWDESGENQPSGRGRRTVRNGVRRRAALGGRRDLPKRPADDRLVRELADGVNRAVEDLEGLVEVVREQEAGHGVDGVIAGSDLVDPGIGGIRPASGLDT